MTTPIIPSFEPLNANSMSIQDNEAISFTRTFPRIRWPRTKSYASKLLRGIHFLIVMVYAWAGLVEFIRNPPFFDAYGDAATKNRLPKELFEDNPWNNNTGTLRLMDLPILGILTGYAGVTTWLKFKGLAWLLTFCVTVVLFVFLMVNFWAKEYFDWRYYETRIIGLELQVTTLALCGTMVLMVLFYKRRRLPFKFKSSLPVAPMGYLHLVYNFISILLITFTCMLLWFTKMYISWSCFKTHIQLMRLCQITSQVQCYPCDVCTFDAMKKCYKDPTNKLYSCNMKLPMTKHGEGAFCIFNYNMSALKFLTIFAYIGGLCVFSSTLLRIVGHYSLRLLFKMYEEILRCFNKTSATLRKHKERLLIAKNLKRKRDQQLYAEQEGISPRDLIYPDGIGDIEGGRSASPISDIFDDNENEGFCDASCG